MSRTARRLTPLRLAALCPIIVPAANAQGQQPPTRFYQGVSRSPDARNVGTIAPGQGAALHDKEYLRLTIELYAMILAQVHAALERGVVGLDGVGG